MGCTEQGPTGLGTLRSLVSCGEAAEGQQVHPQQLVQQSYPGECLFSSSTKREYDFFPCVYSKICYYKLYVLYKYWFGVPSKKDYSLLINAYNNIFIFIHLFLMIKLLSYIAFVKVHIKQSIYTIYVTRYNKRTLSECVCVCMCVFIF